jgi:hypothetical protein
MTERGQLVTDQPLGATVPTALVLLRGSAASSADVLAAVREAGGAGGDDVYVGTRLPVDPKKYEADGREIPMERLDHAVIVVAHGATPAQAAATAAAATAAAGAMAGTTISVQGNLRIVAPGSGPVLGLCVFRRNPSLDPAACYRHWHTTHAALARRFPGGPGYGQLRPTAPCGYDGAALLRYRDLDAMAAGRDDVGYFREVTDDEKRFLDHSRSSVLVFAAA